MRITPTALAGAAMLALVTAPASAHIGIGDTSSLAAGFEHPFSGLDHMTVMIAVGLWAALKSGRALWVWPATFVGVMIVGGLLGMFGVPLPFVEPGILASVVTLGLVSALTVDLPVPVGALIIGLFATFHGHAHGTAVPETGGGLLYLVGFAVATALLHGIGIAAVVGLGVRFKAAVRVAGAACALIGVGLVAGVI
jgi:urease accessory protein